MSSSWDGPVMELTLRLSEDFETKAEDEEEDDDEEEGKDSQSNSPYSQPGENAYHENDIKSVDFYFYPEGRTSSPATYHRREELTKLTRDYAAFRFELTTKIINDRIFPVQYETPDKKPETVVFVLVNVDKTLLDGQDDTSLDGLKQVLATTHFEAVTTLNHRQDQFMMSGQTTITLKGRTRKEVIEDEGSTIQLSRYACKITVGIRTKEEMKIQLFNGDATPKMEEDGITPLFETWTPCVEEMKVYLEDGIKTVSLGGEPADTRKGLPEGFKALSYKDNPLLFFRNDGTDANPDYQQIFDSSNGFYNTYPTYTYPQRWQNGNEGEPYLKLVLPWERTLYEKDGVRYIEYAKKEFYYKILIPNDVREEYANTFQRNNWYHYNIDVGMLGADTDDTEVELEAIDCYVYYWQDKNVVIKHAEIGNARYLSTNQHTITLNNETSCKINLTTSHPVDFRVNSITRPYYGNVTENDDGSFTPASIGEGAAKGIVCKATDGTYYLDYLDAATNQDDATKNWFHLEGGVVTMTHQLNNNYKSTTFDYSPYTMSLTIWHKDQVKSEETKEADIAKTEYKETITITQNPAIYIEAELNSDPQRTDGAGNPVAGDDTKDNTETTNGNRPVWPNYAHAGYVFVDGARMMRHRSGKKDDGEYGIVAKKINPKWTNNAGSVGELRQKLEWLQWRTVNFTGGNRNRYTIHVTVLDKNSEYVIGDPRTRTPETWNNGRESASTVQPDPENPIKYSYWYKQEDPYHYWDWAHYYDGYSDPFDPDKTVDPYVRDENVDEEFSIEFKEAHVINNKAGSKRKLTNYYPAEETDRTVNMLAPALRVSSRFGGVEFYNGFTHQSAKFKCATYQEDGYPAGRWRLPTQAEIRFISTLTDKGGFVQLFSPGGYYWSATGIVIPNGSKPTQTDYAMVRCVYDAWYWDPYKDRLPENERDNYYFGDFAR